MNAILSRLLITAGVDEELVHEELGCAVLEVHGTLFHLHSCLSRTPFWDLYLLCPIIKKQNYRVFIHLYKAHSVIRRTLNFWRRLWQVSKMKISPKYPVIKAHPELREILLTMFAVLTTICFQKLLITVLSVSKKKRKSHTLETIAKKSDMDNNIKVPLFNSLKSSFWGNSVLSYEY